MQSISIADFSIQTDSASEMNLDSELERSLENKRVIFSDDLNIQEE